MFWLTWRQFRVQAMVAVAALAAFAITLAITGVNLSHRYDQAGLAGCRGGHRCRQLAVDFISQMHDHMSEFGLLLAGIVVLYLVPALIGLFWGAPLIARELEAGTLRLAWNQSVSRSRWLAVKLGLIALAAMTTAGLFSLMISWWSSPIDRAISLAGPGSVITLSRIDPLIFGARGIVPVGYAAFALVLGVTAGVLIRRTIPAMGVTLAVFAGVQLSWPVWVRPHLISPSVVRAPLAGNFRELTVDGGSHRMTVVGAWHEAGAWVLSNQTVTPAGRVFTGPATSACLSGSGRACMAWLASKNLRQLVTFQPVSRFWAFQWYETAIFVLLAAALAGVCAWRISRRRLA